MLKRLTVTTLFLILILTLFVSMVGVSEAQTINPPDYFWSFSHRTSVTVLWDGPDLPFAWWVGHYNLRWRKKGDTSWTELSNNIAPGADNVLDRGKTNLPEPSGTDLIPNTTYEYQVRTHAKTVFWVSKTGDWSSTQEVTTKANGVPTTVGSIPDQSKVESSTFTVDVSR